MAPVFRNCTIYHLYNFFNNIPCKTLKAGKQVNDQFFNRRAIMAALREDCFSFFFVIVLYVGVEYLHDALAVLVK